MDRFQPRRFFWTKCRASSISLMILLLSGVPAWAYGPLNHLCVANDNWKAAWNLIRTVDPRINESYARQAFFAGAMADDLGYYPVPGGATLKLLTDSMHYAETGQWVFAQLHDAAANRDGVLFAFALGELSHYAADRMGHYFGTNVVAVQVAGKQSMYGLRMSYERDEPLHFVVESGFDVLAVGSACSPDNIEEIARSLPAGRAWEAAGRVVAFLNQEYQKVYFGARLELKAEYFVQALLIADYLFARTAEVADQLYKIQVPKSVLPAFTRGVEASPENQGPSHFSDWVDERVRAGLAVARSLNPSEVSTFNNSFARANALYALLLAQVDNNISSRVSFDNINLDTNMLSASGEYSLADRTYEHILSHRTKDMRILCPPPIKVDPFGDFFTRGPYYRKLLLTLAWRKREGNGLRDALEGLSSFFRRENEATADDPITLPDLDIVHFTRCSPDEPCLGQRNAHPFMPDASVAVAPGIVNYTAQCSLLDIWLGALAATLMKGQSTSEQALGYVGRRRLEILEDYRLGDPASAAGFYDWPEFCINPPGDGAATKPAPKNSLANRKSEI